MSTPIKVEVGFGGTITGLTRSGNHQCATVEIKNAAGRTLASTTLVGYGNHVPMSQEINSAIRTWSFSPFKEPMNVIVTIENSQTANGVFVKSKVIPPVTVKKEPDVTSPQTFVVSTLLSEDYVDNDHDDCIISIFQYK